MIFFLLEQQAVSNRTHVHIDDVVFALIAQGDADAFALLYAQTERIIYSYVLSMVRDPYATQDIVSDTYIKIRTSSHLYKGMDKPLAWMFSIAKSITADHMRKSGAATAMGMDIAQNDVRFSCIDDPTERLVLLKVLNSLNEQDRRIVLLHAVAGLKHRETAELLGLALPTVLSKYTRALSKLKQMLIREGACI
ncbi:MAG: RNA polymerase sigma factor [Clostridia bacterium]